MRICTPTVRVLRQLRLVLIVIPWKFSVQEGVPLSLSLRPRAARKVHLVQLMSLSRGLSEREQQTDPLQTRDRQDLMSVGGSERENQIAC